MGTRAADKYFMGMALEEARRAFQSGEFPVGCVIVKNNVALASGRRKGTAGDGNNEIDHAEMVALRRIGDLNPGIDLRGAAVYCSMEPCLMCFGAILLSGISKVVYAYEDVMGGATGLDRSGLPMLYRDNRIEIVPHVLREKSLSLFTAFFGSPENKYWRDSLLARYTLAEATPQKDRMVTGD